MFCLYGIQRYCHVATVAIKKKTKKSCSVFEGQI